MKKTLFFAFVLVFCWFSASFAASLGRPQIYFVQGLTTAGTGEYYLAALDIVGNGSPNTYDLEENDSAIYTEISGSTVTYYIYIYDDSGTDAEASPTIIRPDDYGSNGPGVWRLAGTNVSLLGHTLPVSIGIPCSDETTALSTGAGKFTYQMPHAMTLTKVIATVNTAPAGASIIVDVNEEGTTILSTKATIEAGEDTSEDATNAPVISDDTLASGSEITVDVDQVGSSTEGAGLKVWLIGTRTVQ